MIRSKGRLKLADKKSKFGSFLVLVFYLLYKL